MGCAHDAKTITGLIIFGACVLVAALFIVAAFAKAAAQQTPAPLQFKRQHDALAHMLSVGGIVPGTEYFAGGTKYVIRRITIAFDANGNHTIEIKSEVTK